MKRITPAENAELPQLKAQGDQIKKKYARGGPSQAYAARFEKRLAELSAEKVAPAKQAWIAAAFPDASAIASGFSKDAQRLAALRIVDTLLWEQAASRKPPPPAPKSKPTGP